MGFAKSPVMLIHETPQNRRSFEAAPELHDECNCAEFRASGVCDHVLRAAQLRLLRRMIAIESGNPHRT
jgi:hypothetical protein